jgi:SAM-dependent methyltransferase
MAILYKGNSYIKNLLSYIIKIFSVNKPPTYSNYFNTPVKFLKQGWFINERIVELAFVHKQIELDGKGKRILEFGCTRSNLALQLASLGYDVVGVDLREYTFTHPRLKFYKGDLMDFEDNEGFDYITAISSVEHIGLGAYGEEQRESTLYEITSKLSHLLKQGGKIIITVPFGRRYQDRFLRSFSHEEILSLFRSDNLKLITERFYRRTDFKFYEPANVEEAKEVYNSKGYRGPTGVNCVGCFVWEKVSGKGKEER